MRWLAVVVVIVGVVTGCVATSTPRSGEPMEATEATAAALDDMAAVLEEALAGVWVGDAALFVGDLAATRGWVLDHRRWPAADYAVVKAPQSSASDPGAVGLVVWLEGQEDSKSWMTVCAAAQVDRAAARLRLQQVHCPEDVPAGPTESDPRGSAQTLSLALQPDGELISGESPTMGDPTPTRRATERVEAEKQCPAEGLRAAFDSGNAAGNTDDFFLRVQNASANACLMPALTGIEIDGGEDPIAPSWDQASGNVTLQPWESATTHLSYPPHQGRWRHQVITVQSATGPVRVSPSAGVAGTLRVRASSEISATPWQLTGYGVGMGRWEDGYPMVDIAPACRPDQLAVTTSTPRGSSESEPDEPPETHYVLVNISTVTCRLDPGPLASLEGAPTLQVPATVVLLPGTSTSLDIEGGAADLTGTFIIDGAEVPVSGP